MKKIIIVILFLILFITGCASNSKNEDIIILFTSDIHCAVDQNIGYEGLNAYKKNKEATNKYVTLVDLGDAVQGDLIGSISEGLYITEIMNYLEYDFAILGNHEFDYGINQTKNIIDEFNGTYLGCNITYTGTKENYLAKLKPYEIVSYGDVDVAFIGITTPQTISSSTPTHFMENEQYVYDFYAGEEGQRFINVVQDTIDECLEKGADYVIGLSHIGSTSEDEPYSSRDLIKGTEGFDAVLDGHSHVKISSDIILDNKGDEVLLGSTGEFLDAFGQLVITENGNLTLTYIDNYDVKDPSTTEFVDSIVSRFEDEFNKTFITINRSLAIADEAGVRMVRTREMPIGNLIADAYRFVGQTDVAFINGGGIRSDLKEGDISYADIFKIHPFGNKLTTVKATGQEIIDTLEISVLSVFSDYVKDGLPYGENGGYLHVSGLKYDVDTSIPTPVVLDDYESFVEIKGERKVSNVRILVNGEYVPIDPEAIYTVATIDYIVKEGGCSNNLFLDNELIISEGIFDYQVLVEYLLNGVNGDLSSYSSTEGRMNIIK